MALVIPRIAIDDEDDKGGDRVGTSTSSDDDGDGPQWNALTHPQPARIARAPT
jgi:hypothetical protein